MAIRLFSRNVSCRQLPFDDRVKAVSDILFCMSIGSFRGMSEKNDGHCGKSVNRTVTLTTILPAAIILLLSHLY